MAGLDIVSSKKVSQRNLKIMFWGDTATRKTEEVLRHFPHVLIIDAEGNSDMCADNPEIPEYLAVKTKDPRKILQVIDQVSAGKVKFSDGSLVETLCIDSWTVIWSVQQEFANTMAEKRAERYNKDGAEANATQLDWGLAKRPMKMITNRMNNSPVKFLVLICRQKDLYDDKAKKNEQVKIGDQPDAVKGTAYEMNLGLHFINDGDTWKYEVSKVQGTLGRIFPMKKTGTKIDYAALFEFADKIRTSAGKEESETDVASNQVSDIGKTSVKNFASLKEYAISLGIPVESFGEALKSGGWTQYATSAHDTMETYLEEWAAANVQA